MGESECASSRRAHRHHWSDQARLSKDSFDIVIARYMLLYMDMVSTAKRILYRSIISIAVYTRCTSIVALHPHICTQFDRFYRWNSVVRLLCRHHGRMVQAGNNPAYPITKTIFKFNFNGFVFCDFSPNRIEWYFSVNLLFSLRYNYSIFSVLNNLFNCLMFKQRSSYAF